MATRAERFHAEEQRKKGKHGHAAIRPSRSKPGVPASQRSRTKKHAGKKATYALENVAEHRRPARKSTRKSANRAKPDHGFNLREEIQKGSPESRHGKK